MLKLKNRFLKKPYQSCILLLVLCLVWGMSVLASEEQISLADYWWFTEDVMWNGIPDDVEEIGYFDEIVGSWKAVIIANPTSGNYDGTMQFLTASDGATVSMMFSKGSEGDTHSIYFCALSSRTEWQYAWRRVNH